MQSSTVMKESLWLALPLLSSLPNYIITTPDAVGGVPAAAAAREDTGLILAAVRHQSAAAETKQVTEKQEQQQEQTKSEPAIISTIDNIKSNLLYIVAFSILIIMCISFCRNN